jgi:quercetin dioxygenase-like cupin family protein
MKISKLSFILVLSLFTTQIGCAQNHDHSNETKKEAMNHISKLHDAQKEVSAQLLFTGTESKTMALHIQKGGLLKEHITKVEALLVCISGEAVYEDEKGVKHTLKNGDFFRITPMVKHWVKGVEDSQLLLIK